MQKAQPEWHSDKQVRPSMRIIWSAGASSRFAARRLAAVGLVNQKAKRRHGVTNEPIRSNL
ncbi:MAG: hypothetical protein B9S32_16995 [Verrucomicrobia bacterium Tous-C9LFEB]|nr:MAG: hypothetical protein B9S32_16995 [Verrucomicrobia bacterium Tous-C9LFEB]